MLWFDNACECQSNPSKKPCTFQAWVAKSVSSRSVQAYVPADHFLSRFELLATQGSYLAVFMTLMRLELLSISTDEAMIPPKKPVHFKPAQEMGQMRLSWPLWSRARLQNVRGVACGCLLALRDVLQRFPTRCVSKEALFHAQKPVHSAKTLYNGPLSQTETVVTTRSLL